MIIDLFRAMQAGEALANAKTWKQAQLWTSNLTILLSAAVSIAAAFGHPVPLTPEQITTVVSALAVLVGVFQSYVTVATTEKLGVRPAAEPDDPGIPDTSRRATVPGAWLRELDDRFIDDVPILKDKE